MAEKPTRLYFSRVVSLFINAVVWWRPTWRCRRGFLKLPVISLVYGRIYIFSILLVHQNTYLTQEQHHNQMEYQFPSRGLVLSKVFGHLEANRKIFDIEDYSVSQTTLDQVCLVVVLNRLSKKSKGKKNI